MARFLLQEKLDNVCIQWVFTCAYLHETKKVMLKQDGQ